MVRNKLICALCNNVESFDLALDLRPWAGAKYFFYKYISCDNISITMRISVEDPFSPYVRKLGQNKELLIDVLPRGTPSTGVH